MCTKIGICSFPLTDVAAWGCLAKVTSYWGPLTPIPWGSGFPEVLGENPPEGTHLTTPKSLFVCLCLSFLHSLVTPKVPGFKPHKMCQGSVSSIWLVLVQWPSWYIEACTYNLWSALSILWLLSNVLAIMNYLFWFQNYPMFFLTYSPCNIVSNVVTLIKKTAHRLHSHHKLDITSSRNCLLTLTVFWGCIYNWFFSILSLITVFILLHLCSQ